MSNVVTSSLAVGWFVTPDDLRKVFSVDVAELSHVERRWDPQTGRRLPDVRIVDRHAGKALQFEGEVYDEVSELVSAICDAIRCDFHEHGGCDGFGDPDDCIYYVIGPRTKDELTFAEVARLEKQCDRIGAALKKLGFKGLGKPKVQVTQLES